MRIEAIAQQLNYKVDKNASALRTQASNTLALLLFEDSSPDDSQINPFFVAMLASITRACAQHGYDLLVSFQQLSGDWHVDFEDSRKADGLILLGYGDYHDYAPRRDQLLRQGTHFVRWGAAVAEGGETVIGTDNVGGGRDVTAHLIAQGRERIAFVGTADSHFPEFRDRYRGYAQALRSVGLDPLLTLQVDAISSETEGYMATQRLMGRGEPFDAIVAASDLIAIGALRALAEAGLRVPDNVAVTGFDDILAAGMTTPPLTTMAQDTRGAGLALVDALIRLIRNQPVDATTLPARLVVRRSSGTKA